jgi:hypothetical protein
MLFCQLRTKKYLNFYQNTHYCGIRKIAATGKSYKARWLKIKKKTGILVWKQEEVLSEEMDKLLGR